MACNNTHFRKWWPLYAVLGTLFVAACIVVPIVVVNSVNNDDSSSTDSTVTAEPIEIPENTTKSSLEFSNNWVDTQPWNVIKYSYGRENWKTLDNNTVQVTYPKGSFSPSAPIPGGFLFYAQPRSVFPTEEVYLTYKVKMGDDTSFNWVRGGMLPGLWIGELGAWDANKITNGASFRMMWRSGGQAEAYVYAGKQESEFYSLPGYVDNDPFGESVQRGFSKFVAGQWNDVVMRVKLNSPGVADGILEVSVNDKTFSFEKMMWRQTGMDMKINGIIMNSFFGGSDVTWATPTEQYVYFSSFAAYT
jgi:hypothetical protein